MAEKKNEVLKAKYLAIIDVFYCSHSSLFFSALSHYDRQGMCWRIKANS